MACERTFRARIPVVDPSVPTGELLGWARLMGRDWVLGLGWVPVLPPRVWLDAGGLNVVVEVQAVRRRASRGEVEARRGRIAALDAEARRIRATPGARSVRAAAGRTG